MTEETSMYKSAAENYYERMQSYEKDLDLIFTDYDEYINLYKFDEIQKLIKEIEKIPDSALDSEFIGQYNRLICKHDFVSKYDFYRFLQTNNFANFICFMLIVLIIIILLFSLVVGIILFELMMFQDC